MILLDKATSAVILSEAKNLRDASLRVQHDRKWPLRLLKKHDCWVYTALT